VQRVQIDGELARCLDDDRPGRGGNVGVAEAVEAAGDEFVVKGVEACWAQLPASGTVSYLSLPARLRGEHNSRADCSNSICDNLTETLPGSAFGTPAYMSPEQAQCDLDHVGTHSDVYSLRATLHCLLTGKPPVEAPACCDRAISIPEELVRADPVTANYGSGLVESLIRSGQLKQSSGDPAGAATDWRQAVALCEKSAARSADHDTLEAACHALLSGVAGRSGSKVPEADGRREAARAMGMLRRAIEGGFRDADLLRTDAMWGPLRQRGDFQLLLLDLDLPADPFEREG
jgi:serine/threonine protein kinase